MANKDVRRHSAIIEFTDGEFNSEQGEVMMSNDTDTYRRRHLAVAEFIDAWRIIPRALVAGYAYLLYKVVKWYMDLEPSMIKGCIPNEVTDCIFHAPSTQHAALVTAVVGIAAAIFAFYTSTGRKWNGFTKWRNGKHTQSEEQNLTVQ